MARMHTEDLRIDRPIGGELAPDEHGPDELHGLLSELRARRLRPTTPDSPPFFERDRRLAELEERFLRRERARIGNRAREAPVEPDAFVAWFDALEEHGPGQHHPLLEWLARDADLAQMRFFLQQELVAEDGVEDLVALAQRQLDPGPKLELARRNLDAMDVGREEGARGGRLRELAGELVLEPSARPIVWESSAIANLMMGLAYNRRYAYHAIGALGAIELTAPGRCVLVARGLERLGVAGAGRTYDARCAAGDGPRRAQWKRDVLCPLVSRDGSLSRWLAEGALMRMEAGRRAHERYRRELGIEM